MFRKKVNTIYFVIFQLILLSLALLYQLSLLYQLPICKVKGMQGLRQFGKELANIFFPEMECAIGGEEDQLQDGRIGSRSASMNRGKKIEHQ